MMIIFSLGFFAVIYSSFILLPGNADVNGNLLETFSIFLKCVANRTANITRVDNCLRNSNAENT